MRAIPPAAADLLSSAGGIVQNNGIADNAAAPPTLINAMDNAVCPSTRSRRQKHAAAVNRVRLRCQRRSIWRSELRPSQNMAHRPARNGRLVARPISCKSCRPKPRTRVGNQYDTVLAAL
ncbi:hypothetical protein D3C84_600300 [compost metagenome]